jgi:imidazolonepropionase
MDTLILTDATLAAMDPSGPWVLPHAAIILQGDHILWCGPMADLPAREGHRRPLGGRLVTPALIDSHTHIVHGGHRATEWEARLEGRTYEEIARAGGGILSTVRATRLATEDDLVASALPRVDALLAEGVGTLEIKSGYGLDMDTELRMLRAARRISRERPLTVVTSFLGAHAVPPEFQGRHDAYLDEVVLPTLRAAHEEGLVNAVDGFCEGIAFTPAQIARLFEEARALGLHVKLHAEQLSHLGGAQLAARFGALSADHLEYATEADAAAMAASGTVATLLPGAFYTLRERQAPPVQAFRDHGVPMAVATDCNPGSSPLSSLLLAMNMACTLFGLTVQESWLGATRHAARALSLPERGAIAPGHRADLAVWDAESPAEILYRLGRNPLHARIHGGHWC